MHRLTFLIALALLVASCGVSRESTAERDGDNSDTNLSAQDSDEASNGEAPEGDADPSSQPDPTIPPPVEFTPQPDDEIAASVVFADGAEWELSHGEVNQMVAETEAEAEFSLQVFQGPIPAAFVADLVSRMIILESMSRELETVGAEADLAFGREQLVPQLEQLMLASPNPTDEAERLFDNLGYLQMVGALLSTQNSLGEALAADTPEGEGNPCVRHILVETEAEAQEIYEEILAGADFGETAVERSTGPSGPSGGELGCAPASQYVGPFAAAVEGAEVGVLVAPIETEFGWHVLIVDEFQVDANGLVQDAVTARLGGATVEVDQDLGTWDPTALTVVVNS